MGGCAWVSVLENSRSQQTIDINCKTCNWMYRNLPVESLAELKTAMQIHLAAGASLPFEHSTRLTEEEIEVLKQKLCSIKGRDKDQKKENWEHTLTIHDAIALVERHSKRCAATGIRGELRQGALLQLSIDAVDCRKAHTVENVQLLLTQIKYAN